MNELNGNRSRRFVFPVLAAIALGIPGMIVVVASVWSGTLWPFVPILFGGWVLALLVIRAFVVYKIYLGPSRYNGKPVAKKIGRLEARFGEAQRTPRDKN